MKGRQVLKQSGSWQTRWKTPRKTAESLDVPWEFAKIRVRSKVIRSGRALQERATCVDPETWWHLMAAGQRQGETRKWRAPGFLMQKEKSKRSSTI